MKAQEKLKEINEAFDWLTSAKTRSRPATPVTNDLEYKSYYQRRPRHTGGDATSSHWPLVFVAVLIFAVVFFFTSRALIRRNQQQAQATSSTEQIPVVEIDDVQQSSNRAEPVENEPSRGRNRSNEEGVPESSVPTQAIDTNAVQAMATVTVTIDQMTGMLARRDCPTKRTMTYPRGSEPRQYCNLHLPHEPLQPEGELRVKSAARRLVSPGKWFDGKDKSDAGGKQDVKSP